MDILSVDVASSSILPRSGSLKETFPVCPRNVSSPELLLTRGGVPVHWNFQHRQREGGTVPRPEKRVDLEWTEVQALSVLTSRDLVSSKKPPCSPKTMGVPSFSSVETLYGGRYSVTLTLR